MRALVVPYGGLSASPTWAQGSAAIRILGNLTLTGGIDFLNAYLFRGIPQDDTGVVMWPYGDLGIALHSGDGVFKSIGVNVGLWNSLHTGDCRARRSQREALVRIRFLRDVRARLRQGHELRGDLHGVHESEREFNTVRELSFKFALDDSGALGRAATQTVRAGGA